MANEGRRKNGVQRAAHLLSPSPASSLPFNFTRCFIIIATSLGSFSRSLFAQLASTHKTRQFSNSSLYLHHFAPSSPSPPPLFDVSI